MYLSCLLETNLWEGLLLLLVLHTIFLTLPLKATQQKSPKLRGRECKHYNIFVINFSQTSTENQGSKLTLSFGNQLATNGKFWSPDRKFWSPTFFIYHLHKNTILYVTLHARKVTTEERKQLETT